MTRWTTMLLFTLALLGPLAARADVLEATGGPMPTSTAVLAIDAPRIEGRAYQIVGTVQYRDVEGEGYLEMWSHFPDGSRYFSRTLESAGPLARLSGSSEARGFALPFFLSEDSPTPTRLEVNVVLPGPGHVTLTDLRLAPLEGAGAAPGAWWSPRSGGLAGGIGGSVVGVLGGLIGTLCSLGRARRFVEGTLLAILVVGVVSAAAGLVAVATHQPYEVYYPLLLSGILDVTIVLSTRGTVRKRYEALELRRMQACDLG